MTIYRGVPLQIQCAEQKTRESMPSDRVVVSPSITSSEQAIMARNSPATAKSSAKTKPAPGSQPPSKTATAAAKSKSAPKAVGKTASVKPPKAGNPPNGLQKSLQPSKELAAVVGEGMLPRAEVVSKVWHYIKANNLQNPGDRREIIADEKLQRVFGKDKVTMFEMNKHLAQHLA